MYIYLYKYKSIASSCLSSWFIMVKACDRVGWALQKWALPSGGSDLACIQRQTAFLWAETRHLCHLSSIGSTTLDKCFPTDPWDSIALLEDYVSQRLSALRGPDLCQSQAHSVHFSSSAADIVPDRAGAKCKRFLGIRRCFHHRQLALLHAV